MITDVRHARLNVGDVVVVVAAVLQLDVGKDGLAQRPASARSDDACQSAIGARVRT